MIKVLYFARFRDDLGCGEESVALPTGNATLSRLVDTLVARGDRWQRTLGAERVMMAVNQEMAAPNTPIKDGDEVAFFPPVTGG